MKILDQFGNPIDHKVLSEPQTASMAQLHQEFAGHPTNGLTPAKVARILLRAEQGDMLDQCDLFQDMEEKDAHIYAELSKRKRVMATLDWDVVAPANASAAEKKNAEWVKEQIQGTIKLKPLLLDMGDAIGNGFVNLEKSWHRVGREWAISKIEHRPQRWFQTDIATRTEIRMRDNSPDGAVLWPFGWIKHVHRAKSGYIHRAGLHRILAWPFMFKAFSVRDLAEFLEIYGLPIRMGKYPPGASKEERLTLLRAVTEIGHNAAGIMPEGMSIEIEKAAEGHHDPFTAMMDWAERSESKAILGGTLTSQADGKSSTNALGNVHNEVRHELLESDADIMGETLTTDLVYELLALNGRAPDDISRCPRFIFDTGEAEDLKTFADALPELVDIGMEIPTVWAHEKLRIPKRNGQEPILVRPKAEPQVDPDAPIDKLKKKPGETKADLTARLAALNAEDRDEFDELAEDMVDDWERVSNPLIAPVFAAAAKAESFEAFRAQLPELLKDMDVTALTEALAHGQFAAAIYGRVNDGREE